MKMQKCPICETEFKVYGKQKRVYCSRLCMKRAYSERFSGVGNPNSKNAEKYCRGCGKRLFRKTKGDYCAHCRDLAGEANPFYGRKHSADTKQKMSQSHADFHGEKNPFAGQSHSEEVRAMLSEEKKKLWSVMPEKERKKVISNLMRGLATQRSGAYTNPEMIVAQELDKMELSFDHNAPLYGKFFVDFLLPCGTIIEVFGDYWHGNPDIFKVLTETQKKQQAKDRSRVAYLKACGHRVIVLWEHDLKKDPCMVEEAMRTQ